MQRSNKNWSSDNSSLLGLFLLIALRRRGQKEQNGLVLEAGNSGTAVDRYLPNTLKYLRYNKLIKSWLCTLVPCWSLGTGEVVDNWLFQVQVLNKSKDWESLDIDWWYLVEEIMFCQIYRLWRPLFLTPIIMIIILIYFAFIKGD